MEKKQKKEIRAINMDIDKVLSQFWSAHERETKLLRKNLADGKVWTRHLESQLWLEIPERFKDHWCYMMDIEGEPTDESKSE